MTLFCYSSLGFTFYCGKNRYGGFKVKRKTARKKLRQSLAKFSDWLQRRRGHLPTGELVKRAIARFNGHLNYYAITDNLKKCSLCRHLFRRILFKWLNRRSQRKSYNWKGFEEMLRRTGMSQVKIRHNLNPFNLKPNV